MGNAKHWLIVKQGTTALAEWQAAHPDTALDLTWADLSHLDLNAADLSHADLRWANLSYANLQGANLQHAKLHKASLLNTDLSDASLSSADLSASNLKWTNLCQADLTQANLSEAQLTESLFRNADLSNSNFSNAVLQGADLSHATGCDLSDEQQSQNAAGYKPPLITKGYFTLLISIALFLALLTATAVVAPWLDELNMPKNLPNMVLAGVLIGTLTLGFLIGGYQITKDKGYPGELGLILTFLFSLLGIVIIALLPNRNKSRFS